MKMTDNEEDLKIEYESNQQQKFDANSRTKIMVNTFLIIISMTALKK